MRKKLLFLYALLCLLPISAFSQTEFYYLPDAIDVSTLSNSSETKVVMHAGGSTVNKWIAANTVTGTDYYNDGFDAIDDTNANFIYTLVKDGSGNLSIRDSHGKYLPKWSGTATGQFSNNQTSAKVYNFTLSGDASNKQDADGNAYTLTGSDTGGLPIVYLTGNNRLGVNGGNNQTCESVTFQFFAVYDWEDLQTAITNAQTFYDGSFLNNTPSLKTLPQTIAEVQNVYDNRSNLAKTDMEEAINKLHTAMNEAEAAIVTGRAHRQTFRFRNMGYGTPLYMTVNNANSDPGASNSSDCLLTQAWSQTSAAKQTFTLVDGADGKFYIQWGDLRVTTDGSSSRPWNPSMTAEGFLFAFENRMLDDIDACYTIKSTRGWLGLNADASGTNSPLYTDKGVLHANIHWFVEPLPLSAEQGKAALNDLIEEVNAWKTAYVDKLNNQTTTSLQALATALTDAQAAYSNAGSGLNDYKTAYNALYEAFSGARENYLAEADSEQAFKLRSLAHGGNLYLYVKDNGLKGVIIKDNPAAPYLRDQMFKFVKGSADGQYKIQCVAGNGFMQNSEGENYYDIKCAADGEGSEYTVSYIGNNAYTISKSSGNYFSPDNTLKEDGTYIVYSNWGTANAWVLEPVSAEEVEKGNNAYYKTLYELYQTYLPYKNLYVAEKAGLPGYPKSNESLTPANTMDNYLESAENYLNDNVTNLTDYEITDFSNRFPYALKSLEANLVNYPENRYFSIKNTDNRGYLVYAADAPKGTETGSGEEWNYVWSTGKSYNVTNEEETTSVSVTFDASNAAHLWCFLNHTKVDGTAEHYLYNVGLKKYARPTKVVGTYGDYTWVLTDEPAPITLKVYDAPNHKMAITAKSAEVASDTEVYASVSNNYTGPVINYYTQNDGGVPFTFDWGTKDFVAEDTTAVAALVRTPITLRTVAKDQDQNPLITGLENNQSICTYSSTKTFRVPAGVTAYYATEKDARHIVRLKAVPNGIVPANQGVILVGAVNKTKAMLDVDYRTEVTAESNIFRNTASGPTAMGDNCYVLANSTEGIGFYHATEGSTLSQGKAYLDFSGSSVRAFTLSFGDDGPTTGISSIKADGNAEKAPVYDLSGRRIAEPLGRGIYIKNGKKYFVK